MSTRSNYCVLVLIVLLGLLCGTNSQRCNPACKAKPPYRCDNTNSFNRGSFPKGFVFGAATAAYQIEGGEGRGLNIWDAYTHRWPFRTPDLSNGDKAVESYKYWKEDVELLKRMGADAYRFSIAWSRVLPKGKLSKGVSEDGVAYYNNLINELTTNNIKPFVTLYHWDLPIYLEDDYGGFLSRKIVDDFKDFAELCFQRFGDRVKYWITFNQPYSVATKGYNDGSYPPGRCSSWKSPYCDGGDSSIEPYIVTHNEILAHATVAQLYRNKYKSFQKGNIGITLISRWFVPLNETNQEDRDTVPRAMAFFLGWYMDPLYKGDYPEIMKQRVGSRLPKFTQEEIEMVKGSCDFLGLNYYVTQYVTPEKPLPPSFSNDVSVKYKFDRNGTYIGMEGNAGNSYYPPGFRSILNYIKNEYNNPPIYITENGLNSNGTSPLSELMADQQRIELHCSHLACVKCAMQNNSDVRGYFAWSLLDNFEFGGGYSVRFGLNYVDYNNPKDRKPKQSGEWYGRFLKTGKKSETLLARAVRTAQRFPM